MDTSQRTVVVGAFCSILSGCLFAPPAGLHEVDATFARGVPIVDAQINGVSTRCVVDTGNPGFYLSTRFGGQPGIGFGANNSVPVERLVFGNWEFAGEATTASDAAMLRIEQSLGESGVDCVLGASVLANFRVSVDYSNETVNFADAESEAFYPPRGVGDLYEVPLFFSDGLLVGAAQFADDFEGLALFSTGEPAMVLTPEAYDDLSEVPALTETDDESVQTGRLSRISLGPTDVFDVPFKRADPRILAQLEATVGFQVDASIGAAVLVGFHSTFDFPAGVLKLYPYDDDERLRLYEKHRADMPY